MTCPSASSLRAMRRPCRWGGVAVLLLLLSALPAIAKVVVIDAGHGGHDRGGIPGQRVPEKVVALDVAKRLEKKLRAAGYRTVMTRTSDVFVTLGRRVAIANRHRNSLLVSVHFNSAQRVGAEGFETFYYGSSSYPIAAKIQANLMKLYPTVNRGVKRRGFYVLRRTRSRAVLVECGFLTNPKEARLALKASHRERLAQAIADGIVASY